MDELQGTEVEAEGSVILYTNEPEYRKQRHKPPWCTSLTLSITSVEEEASCHILIMMKPNRLPDEARTRLPHEANPSIG